MKILFSLSLVILSFSTFAQEKNQEAAIRELLQIQTKAWNKGDIEGFMQTYWKSDSLMFVGKSGVVRGWKQTLDNYKKGYPDTAAMGKLSFDIIEVRPLGKNHYFVVGKWMLQRTAGDLSGHYTLLMRRIKGQWKIVADHSS